MEDHKCSPLAWKIPWTEEPGGLQSTGSQRVGHDQTISTGVAPLWDWQPGCSELGRPVRWLIPGLGEIFPQPNFQRQNRSLGALWWQTGSHSQTSSPTRQACVKTEAKGHKQGSFLDHLYLKIFFGGKKKVGNAKHFYIKTNADNIE